MQLSFWARLKPDSSALIPYVRGGLHKKDQGWDLQCHDFFKTDLEAKSLLNEGLVCTSDTRWELCRVMGQELDDASG